MPRTPQDLVGRFWSKVDQSGNHPQGCHEWTKARRPAPDNYGSFKWVNPITGRQESVNASRVAFYLTHGYLPEVACHTCDNPPCCRPDHIYDGNHQTNGADKAGRGRARGKTDQQGEANDSAVLTDAIVIDARKRSKAGETQKSIADSYGVQVPVLGYAIRGQTWNHLDEIEAPHMRRVGGGSRLSAEDIRAIRIDAANGASATLLAQRHGISTANIYAIISRRSWKHVE